MPKNEEEPFMAAQWPAGIAPSRGSPPIGQRHASPGMGGLMFFNILALFVSGF
jgi:hypothetical protein